MNEKTTVYLIRHGELDNPGGLTYGRQRDIHLSEEGREQIIRLAESIRARGDKPDVIVTSPLSRTMETSQILADAFRIKNIVKDSDLLETDSKGFVGLPIEQVRRAMGDIYKDRNSFEMEDPGNIADRMKRAFFRAIQMRHGQTVFVVSHGDPLAFLCDSLLHPEGPLRSIVALRNDLFLLKGAAWRCIVDSNGIASGWQKF